MNAYIKGANTYCIGIEQNQLEFSKSKKWIDNTRMFFTSFLTESAKNDMHSELDRMNMEMSDLK